MMAITVHGHTNSCTLSQMSSWWDPFSKYDGYYFCCIEHSYNVTGMFATANKLITLYVYFHRS